MKMCTVCKVEKLFSAFGKLKTSKDELQFKCKACMKVYYDIYSKTPRARKMACARVKRYYSTTNGRHVKHLYDTSPKKKEYSRIYRQTMGGVAARKREQARISKLKLHIVYSAVRRKLKKQPCVICGEHQRVHAHHENYSRPLEVVWLCQSHHAERHVEIRRSENVDME